MQAKTEQAHTLFTLLMNMCTFSDPCICHFNDTLLFSPIRSMGQSWLTLQIQAKRHETPPQLICFVI